MTDAAHRELLDATASIAVLVAGAYVAFHLIRYIVILINRGIDRDIHAAHRRMGHHRYTDPDDAAHGVPRDGLSVEPGQSGIEWLCKRARERRERAGRGMPGDGLPIDGGSAMAGVGIAGLSGRPPGPRGVRASRPVVVVRGGAFAGARVRVLMESRELAGLWFVEVLDGAGRGGVAVVAGDWLG